MEAAWRAGRDYYMPMGHADDSVDTDDLVQASTESAIPASNRGYALLQRLGWREGKGLGLNEDGGRLTSSALARDDVALRCTGMKRKALSDLGNSRRPDKRMALCHANICHSPRAHAWRMLAPSPSAPQPTCSAVLHATCWTVSTRLQLGLQ